MFPFRRPPLRCELNITTKDEKQQDSASQRPSTRRRNTSNSVAFTVLFFLAWVISLYHRQWFELWSRGLSVYESPKFDWNTAPTTKSLKYAKCYSDDGGYQCAKLELPMDYWNHTTNATISLAVIRKPALVPVTDKTYGGAILLNPGGPGGSGIEFMLRAGDKIQKIVDSENEKYFDLISFDPRGVQFSTPMMRCFQDSGIAQAWQMRVMEEGIFASSDAALGRLWSMATAHGGSCSLPTVDGKADIKEYMSTASVARDMVSLIEAHGAWRERETKHWVSHPFLQGVRFAEQRKRLIYKPGHEKIQYWGFSYGSYLGMTFAAMFPDRIHRLIVDGVVDAEDYRKAWWYDNLVDSEADLDTFYHNCARVGYSTCALANETGASTPQGIENRTLAIIESLYHNPLPVIGPYPEVITYSDAKNLIFANLYSPIKGFPYMAKLLADIEKGNATRFAQLLKPKHQYHCPLSPHDYLGPLRKKSKSDDEMDWGAQMAIACTDAEDQSWMTRDDFKEYWKLLDKLSPSIGDMWSNIRLSCTHFSIRAKTRFVAPFVGNTSHPLLFIGNTADPVTPLGNAIEMARGYEGAVALRVDTPGHCSLAAKSDCTNNHVKRYFRTGELPPVNTTCEVEEIPFGNGTEEAVEGNEVWGRLQVPDLR